MVEIRSQLASKLLFAHLYPIRWRGTAQRVLLATPTLKSVGLVAVWIGEPIDRDYSVRCERTDICGAPRCWRVAVARHDAVAARLGCAPDRTSRACEPRGLDAA